MDELEKFAGQVAQDAVNFGVGTLASQGAKDLMNGTMALPAVSMQILQKFAFSEVIGKILSTLVPLSYIPGLITSFFTRIVFNKKNSYCRMAEETAVNGGIAIASHLMLGPIGGTVVASAATTLADDYLFPEEEDPADTLKRINGADDKQDKASLLEKTEKSMLWMANECAAKGQSLAAQCQSQIPSPTLKKAPTPGKP